MAKQKYKEYRVNSIPSSGLVAGDNYLLNLGAKKYRRFIVGDNIYEINRSIPLNGNTILYVNGLFQESATAFNVEYRNNIKIILDAMSRTMHDYACKRLRNERSHPEWHTINTAASMRQAAFGFFKIEDYTSANDLIVSNYELLRKYSI